MLTPDEVKNQAKKLGADLCGIAPAERFSGAPEGFRPANIYPACQSVIVIAKRVPPALFQSKSPSPYTMVAEIERMHTVDTLSVSCATIYTTRASMPCRCLLMVHTITGMQSESMV